MAKLQLAKARIQAGVWEGVLTTAEKGDTPPQLSVTHLTHPVDGVSVTAHPDQADQFVVKVPIPADLLCDGVQTFVISDTDSGELLESFSIVTGQPLDDDIRAEMDLIRAELDMLKRAFRRHCMEAG